MSVCCCSVSMVPHEMVFLYLYFSFFFPFVSVSKSLSSAGPCIYVFGLPSPFLSLSVHCVSALFTCMYLCALLLAGFQVCWLISVCIRLFSCVSCYFPPCFLLLHSVCFMSVRIFFLHTSIWVSVSRPSSLFLVFLHLQCRQLFVACVYL